MRNIHDWSNFINLHHIPNINDYLLVQGNRLCILARNNVLSRRYSNRRACTSSWSDNTWYSVH